LQSVRRGTGFAWAGCMQSPITPKILVATALASLTLIPLAHGEEAQPAAETAACDLKTADRWSQDSQAAIDLEPAKHGERCVEVAAYAAAAAAVAAQKLPQPCSAFSSLAEDRKQVAQYNWAYGSAMELLKDKGKADRAARIAKALGVYNSQFDKYEGKVKEFRDLCVRVHSPEQKASARDVAMWSQSGRMMSKGVVSGRLAVWGKGGVKSSLDSSFKSVITILK